LRLQRSYFGESGDVLNKVSPRQAELFAATRIANNHASMYGAVDLANEDIGSLLQRALP
jgi:putative acyl-CoA dehydrogenase